MHYLSVHLKRRNISARIKQVYFYVFNQMKTIEIKSFFFNSNLDSSKVTCQVHVDFIKIIKMQNSTVQTVKNYSSRITRRSRIWKELCTYNYNGPPLWNKGPWISHSQPWPTYRTAWWPTHGYLSKQPTKLHNKIQI